MILIFHLSFVYFDIFFKVNFSNFYQISIYKTYIFNFAIYFKPKKLTKVFSRPALVVYIQSYQSCKSNTSLRSIIYIRNYSSKTHQLSLHQTPILALINFESLLFRNILGQVLKKY